MLLSILEARCPAIVLHEDICGDGIATGNGRARTLPKTGLAKVGPQDNGRVMISAALPTIFCACHSQRNN